MKFTSSASLLSALWILGTSVDAFATRKARFAPKQGRTLPRGTEKTFSPKVFSSSSRQDTALFVSSIIQDRLKRIGDSIDVDNAGSTFLQQLKKPSFSQRELGLLVLLTVPVAWGTYAPTVQSLYALDSSIQLPGFIFSTFYFFVAASGSLLATVWSNNHAPQEQQDAPNKAMPAIAGLELGCYVYLANFLHVIGLQTVPSDRAGFLFQLTTVMVPMLEAFFAWDLLAIPASTWVACALALSGIFVMGMEWPFGAAASETIIQSGGEVATYVNSDMGVDLATGLDPGLLAMDQTAATATNVDMAAAQAIVADSTQAMVDSSSSLLDTLVSGDALIVGAAFLYALQIIRISKWTAEYSPLQIMTGKTVAESFFSFLFLGGTAWLASSSGMDFSHSNGALAFLQTSGQQSIDFFQTISQRMAEGTISSGTIEHFAGACLWTGLITTCYLVFAQSYGQQYVEASDANLIYSLQPLFTAVFAYYMLGETLQPMGYVGGAFIGAAVYLVASKSLTSSEDA